MLSQHPDPNMAHSSLQSALQMDPNQAQSLQQQAPATQQPPLQTNPRKRKKADSNGDDVPHPAEPRRLRRSHEACARCRSKKIKCDSKHPRCTACATAGVVCHQEDRHRQTLIARGHTERIERQLAGCIALLKRHIPTIDINNVDEILAREGIDVDTTDPNNPAFSFQNSPGGPRGFPLRSEGAPPPDGSPPRYPYPPPPMMHHPGYPAPMPMHYGPPGPYGPPPPHVIPGPPPPGYNPNIYPPFQHPLPPPPIHHQQQQHQQQPPQPPQPQLRPPSSLENRTVDPLPHDLSSSEALARNFGVSAAIVSDLKLAPQPMDTEDLAVGSAGLSSRRDRDIAEPSLPRDAAKWVSVSMRRNSIASPTSPTLGNASSPSGTSSNSSVAVWLPKDRKMVQHILDVYFSRLNYHRPVFSRASFDQRLWALYENQTVQHDPGYICSVYLVLALGTLSELNHRVNGLEKDGNTISANAATPKKLMPPDWPEHEEFFRQALAVKPELRVTVSSLQALILLHWYLYTERQGRTLWRLVGSLVRLAIELNLHHDPTLPLQPINVHDPNPPAASSHYTEEECQLRIRLWGIVLLHDRGTSILLGRPLAIAPSDSNTSRPTRGKGGEISEHFVLSAPIAEIQADIINSLYAPTTQSADSIMRHATRIIKSMVEFRRQLPESYKWFFSGTEDWPPERRSQLVQDITEDQGLTLLKIGITRILLLRALFSSNEVHYNARYRALVDAIVTSHNIIVVHNQLIRFPDIAFFVSPIPLHIAAMVILFGHMSKCERLPREVAMEDVWMALDMLPSFRWRWERKDMNGGHPLIAKLAEEVLQVNLHQVAPATAPMLLSEQDWDTESILSPKSITGGLQQPGPQPPTPTMGPAAYPSPYSQPTSAGSSVKGSPGKVVKNGLPGTPVTDKKLAEVPPGLFYPFYPGDQNAATSAAMGIAAAAGNGGPSQDFDRLLAVAGAPPIGYGYPSSESFMLEEKDPSMPQAPSGMQMWMNNNGEQKPMHAFPMPPPT